MLGIEDFTKRPWLLLPGTLCTMEVFSGFLDALGVAAALRLPISIAHPAIEDFEADFAETMRPGAVVCGFSLGAIVAAHYADRLDASAMLLFGLNPRADDPSRRSGRLALEQDVIALGARSAMAKHMPALFGPEPAAARAKILTMSAHSAALISPQTRLASTRPGALNALRGALFPVLAITGAQDSAAPVELAREVAANAPCGRSIELPNLGHYALIEDPQTCSAAVTQFFTELA